MPHSLPTRPTTKTRLSPSSTLVTTTSTDDATSKFETRSGTDTSAFFIFESSPNLVGVRKFLASRNQPEVFKIQRAARLGPVWSLRLKFGGNVGEQSSVAA